MLPPAADADQEDPTSQIAWPNSRSALRRESDSRSDESLVSTPVPDQEATMPARARESKKGLSSWDLITLSISMLGAQIVWTVELGYVSFAPCVFRSSRRPSPELA